MQSHAILMRYGCVRYVLCVPHAWCLIGLLYDFYMASPLCLRPQFLTMNFVVFAVSQFLLTWCSPALPAFFARFTPCFSILSHLTVLSIHITSGNFVVFPSYTHLCLVLRFSWPGIIVPPSCTLTHHTVTHQHFAYFLAQTCFYYILIHLSMCTVYYFSSPSALLHFLGTLCVLLDHSLVHGWAGAYAFCISLALTSDPYDHLLSFRVHCFLLIIPFHLCPYDVLSTLIYPSQQISRAFVHLHLHLHTKNVGVQSKRFKQICSTRTRE